MGRKSPPVADQPLPKQRLAVVITGEVVERAKNAVYFEPGLTLASLMEGALTVALNKLERKRGEPYPARQGLRLKPGRPIK